MHLHPLYQGKQFGGPVPHYDINHDHPLQLLFVQRHYDLAASGSLCRSSRMRYMHGV